MNGRILYDPLAVLGKWRGFVIGLVMTVVLTISAWWGKVAVYPLAPQVAGNGLSAFPFVAGSLISWLLAGIMLFLVSKSFGGNGGVGAHLAAVGLSRLPYLLAAIILSRQVLGDLILRAVAPEQTQFLSFYSPPPLAVTPGLAVAAIAILLLMFWSVVMLYLGYRESSRLPTLRAVSSFLIGVGLAEAAARGLASALRWL